MVKLLIIFSAQSVALFIATIRAMCSLVTASSTQCQRAVFTVSVALGLSQSAPGDLPDVPHCLAAFHDPRALAT
jgi:hypothetical protein